MPENANSSENTSAWPNRLLNWYEDHARSLPWRDHPEPYRVWISEIMLQQTQVKTVIPYFDRFILKFPDVAALATADEQEVLKAWEGLGYYSRARNMLKAAKMVQNEFGGDIPGDFETLKTLPGVGDYTAAAIAGIAFNQPVPVIDGNVVRVFCRIWAIDDDARSQTVKRRLFDRLKTVIANSVPSDFNQAIMELGALICRPSNPDCTDCPLRPDCAAVRERRVHELPFKPKRKPIPTHRVAVGVIRKNGRILVQRRSPDGMLGGLWEFPGAKLAENANPAEAIADIIKRKTALTVTVRAPLPPVKHGYSHFNAEVHPFLCDIRDGAPLSPRNDQPLKWISLKQRETLPFSKASSLIFDAVNKVAQPHSDDHLTKSQGQRIDRGAPARHQ